jgi:hypothetical protein
MNIQRLTIGQEKQLLEINHQLVNFRASFRITSLQQQPFYFLIADQETLNTQHELSFNQATDGTIEGDVEMNKNVYHPYYLVIYADDPMDVEVSLKVEEIKASSPKTNQAIVWVVVALLLSLIAYYVYRSRRSIDVIKQPSLLEQMKKNAL